MYVCLRQHDLEIFRYYQIYNWSNSIVFFGQVSNLIYPMIRDIRT